MTDMPFRTWIIPQPLLPRLLECTIVHIHVHVHVQCTYMHMYMHPLIHIHVHACRLVAPHTLNRRASVVWNFSMFMECYWCVLYCVTVVCIHLERERERERESTSFGANACVCTCI